MSLRKIRKAYQQLLLIALHQVVVQALESCDADKRWNSEFADIAFHLIPGLIRKSDAQNEPIDFAIEIRKLTSALIQLPDSEARVQLAEDLLYFLRSLQHEEMIQAYPNEFFAILKKIARDFDQLIQLLNKKISVGFLNKFNFSGPLLQKEILPWIDFSFACSSLIEKTLEENWLINGARHIEHNLVALVHQHRCHRSNLRGMLTLLDMQIPLLLKTTLNRRSVFEWTELMLEKANAYCDTVPQSLSDFLDFIPPREQTEFLYEQVRVVELCIQLNSELQLSRTLEQSHSTRLNLKAICHAATALHQFHSLSYDSEDLQPAALIKKRCLLYYGMTGKISFISVGQDHFSQSMEAFRLKLQNRAIQFIENIFLLDTLRFCRSQLAWFDQVSKNIDSASVLQIVARDASNSMMPFSELNAAMKKFQQQTATYLQIFKELWVAHMPRIQVDNKRRQLVRRSCVASLSPLRTVTARFTQQLANYYRDLLNIVSGRYPQIMTADTVVEHLTQIYSRMMAIQVFHQYKVAIVEDLVRLDFPDLLERAEAIDPAAMLDRGAKLFSEWMFLFLQQFSTTKNLLLLLSRSPEIFSFQTLVEQFRDIEKYYDSANNDSVCEILLNGVTFISLLQDEAIPHSDPAIESLDHFVRNTARGIEEGWSSCHELARLPQWHRKEIARLLTKVEKLQESFTQGKLSVIDLEPRLMAYLAEDYFPELSQEIDVLLEQVSALHQESLLIERDENKPRQEERGKEGTHQSRDSQEKTPLCSFGNRSNK